MNERAVIIGAGGFGRETLDVVEALTASGASIELLGVVDAGPRPADLERLAERQVRYLGTEEEWMSDATPGSRFIVAIGAPRVRKAVAERLENAGFEAMTVIHPHAVLGSRTRVGNGVVIGSGAQVSTNVTIGDHVHLNPGSIVGHDVDLHKYVSINPGAVVSGDVVIESESLVGAGAVVLQSLRIGRGATVGASACVTKDVPMGATVKGVPAR